MRRTITAVLALFALGGGRVDATASEAERVFALVSPSIVTVKTFDDKQNPQAQGSGVVLAKGYVASNCHVVEEAVSIRVVAGQGELAALWSKRLPGMDLCLLKVDGLQAASLPLRTSNTLQVGEAAYAVGNPLGFGLAVSKGLIASVKQAEPYPVVVATAPQSHGSSGGGLFDTDGRLLGITTAVLGNGQNLNLILPSEGLTALLEKGEAPPPAPRVPSAERLWSEEATQLHHANNWADLEKLSQAWSLSQPSSAWPLAYMGMAQNQLKRLPEAEATLRKGLVLNEYLSFTWVNLADVLESMGKHQDAEQALQRAQSAMPNYAEPNIRRARWLIKQGKHEAALVQAKEALRKDAGGSLGWILLGNIEDELGHGAQASHAFSTALRLGSADTEVKRRLTELSAQSGNPDAAIRMGVLKDMPGEQESRAQLAIGLSEMKRGRLAQAEEAIRKAIALSPHSSSAWNELGSVQFKTSRLTEAEATYTKAIELGPANIDPLVNRAQVRRTRQKLGLALEDAKLAIGLAPNNWDAWGAYASVTLDMRDYAQANSGFSKMNELAPLSSDYLVSWGDSLLGMGELDAAQNVLVRAEAADPKLVRMCLTMAKLLGRKNDVEGALRYENRALELEPTSVQAWSGKGYALMKLGRLLEAVEALETAVRLDPGLTNAWINLGEAQMRNRNFGRAIQALEKAVKQNQVAPDARFFLAQSYLSARLPLKSREQAQKLLDMYPEHVPALGLVTFTYLMEGNDVAASSPYTKLKTLAPSTALSIRKQALAMGFAAARKLPE